MQIAFQWFIHAQTFLDICLKIPVGYPLNDGFQSKVIFFHFIVLLVSYVIQDTAIRRNQKQGKKPVIPEHTAKYDAYSMQEQRSKQTAFFCIVDVKADNKVIQAFRLPAEQDRVLYEQGMLLQGLLYPVV